MKNTMLKHGGWALALLVVVTFGWTASALEVTVGFVTVTYQGGFLEGPGTNASLAKARRVAFERALKIWTDQLVGPVPLKLRAEFKPLRYDSIPADINHGFTFAVSNSTNAWANLGGLPGYQGLPYWDTWFPAAVASQLCGYSLAQFRGPRPENYGYHMYCIFNSDIDGIKEDREDPNSPVWAFQYTDTNVLQRKFDFTRVALHEIGHGLGFAVVPQYWLTNPPSYVAGYPDIYSYNLVYRPDPNQEEYARFAWLNDSQRYNRMLSGHIWWAGSHVVAYGLTHPRPVVVNLFGESKIYAVGTYIPYSEGVQLSHWVATPPPDELLMGHFTPPLEPNTPLKRDVDITAQALMDIYWDFSGPLTATPGRLEYHGTPGAPGLPEYKEVTIANNSGSIVTIDAMWLEGPHADQFPSFSYPTPFDVWYLESSTVFVFFDPTSTGYKTATLRIAYSLGAFSWFKDVELVGYAVNVDSDGDGLSDTDETRDLDPETPDIDNPFNASNPDSTGDNGGSSGDWVDDGFDDWDGDGMSNEDEFIFGYNPIDPTSYGRRTAQDTDGDGLSDADESRDLDPDTAGLQNPFDPYYADRTGDNSSNEPDGIRDGLNDYDEDGVNNETEFRLGCNPLRAGDCGEVPSSDWPVLLAAACFLALYGIKKVSDLSKC